MKVCTKCGLEQPIDNYYEIKKTGKRHGSCKTCFKKRARDSAERLGRRHRKDIELRHHYGIGMDDYDAMMERQGGKCVCGSTIGRPNATALHVDHCHDTGHVRGLLCNKCNRALGLVGDPELLRGLADYLESANSRRLQSDRHDVVSSEI